MCGRPALVAGRLQMGSQVWVAALGGETAKKHSVRRGVSVACLAFEAPSSRRQRAHAATFSIGLLLHGAELPPSDISKQKTTQLTAQNRAPPRHKAGTCPPRPGAVALGAGRTSTAWPSQPRKLCSHHSASRPCGAFHAATTAAAGPQPLLPGQASCACSAAPSRTVSATRLRTAYTARPRLLASPMRDARLQKVVGVAAGRWQLQRQCMHESECQACLSITSSMCSPRHRVPRGRPARWPSSNNACPATQPPPHPHSWLPCCTDRPQHHRCGGCTAVRRVHRASTHKATSGCLT